MFPNFLRSYVLRRSENCEAFRIRMFISKNRTLSRLWPKENLVKHEKVSNITFLQKFVSLFMFYCQLS